jgi:hypothetical protein
VTRSTTVHVGVEVWLGWVPVRHENIGGDHTWYFGFGRVWYRPRRGYWL